VREFGMEVQAAIEKPRFGNFSYPNSFAPHQYLPGRLCIEKSLDQAFGAKLRAMGHDIEVWQDLAPTAGAVCAILRDEETDLLHAGADPRREGTASAW